MIRVYFLQVETIGGTEQVAGIEYIHGALLDCTEDPDVRKLIQDTTEYEDMVLIEAGAVDRDATQEDIDRYNAQVFITPPDPDVVRAQELLATSPPAVTMPEIWELLRIFARLHGIIT